MPETIHNIAAMQRIAAGHRREGRRIAVVPTMGFLHEGHLTLIREARSRADVVITTVFVNPAQFGAGEDFNRYPRDLTRDVQLAGPAGTDYVFAPGAEAVYPEGYCTYVNVTRIDEVLEGKSRPGHFRGVATIVLKLMNITPPHCAVFGQKDAQQVVVVRRMMRDLNLDIELVVVPTVREPDGLAMSSRNTYLTALERSEAPVLYKALRLAEKTINGGERNSAPVIRAMRELIAGHSSGVVDYISVADGNTLEEVDVLDGPREVLISLAVKFGSTRLIDNVIVRT